MARNRTPARSGSIELGEVVTPTASIEPRQEYVPSFFGPDKPIDNSTAVAYNSSVDRVAIQLKFPAKVIRSGLVSGEQYEWSEAGAVVQVRIEDVDQLLQLKVGEAGCCGGSPNFLFQKV